MPSSRKKRRIAFAFSIFVIIAVALGASIYIYGTVGPNTVTQTLCYYDTTVTFYVSGDGSAGSIYFAAYGKSYTNGQSVDIGPCGLESSVTGNVPLGYEFRSWDSSNGMSNYYANPSTTNIPQCDTYLGCVWTIEAVFVLAPFNLTVSATPSAGYAPLTVQFSVTPNGGVPSFSYSWTFGDGSSSSQQNPSHTYTSSGNYLAQITATDSQGHQASGSAAISVNSPGGTTTSTTTTSPTTTSSTNNGSDSTQGTSSSSNPITTSSSPQTLHYLFAPGWATNNLTVNSKTIVNFAISPGLTLVSLSSSATIVNLAFNSTVVQFEYGSEQSAVSVYVRATYRPYAAFADNGSIQFSSLANNSISVSAPQAASISLTFSAGGGGHQGQQNSPIQQVTQFGTSAFILLMIVVVAGLATFGAAVRSKKRKS